MAESGGDKSKKRTTRGEPLSASTKKKRKRNYNESYLARRPYIGDSATEWHRLGQELGKNDEELATLLIKRHYELKGSVLHYCFYITAVVVTSIKSLKNIKHCSFHINDCVCACRLHYAIPSKATTHSSDRRRYMPVAQGAPKGVNDVNSLLNIIWYLSVCRSDLHVQN